jgi:hypothetical protein
MASGSERRRPTNTSEVGPVTSELQIVAEGPDFFQRLRDTYIFDLREEALLEAAERAWRRWRSISDQIDAEGLQVSGRYGVRQHPLLAAEALARRSFISAIKELRLPDPSRRTRKGAPRG